MIKRNISVIFMILFLCCNCCFAQYQVGKASYYAKRFHGRRTASGEKYNKDSLTCAHRLLPFGTRVLVKNIKNNKTVVVKVTDRGPYCKNRLIDLSYSAAHRIGMLTDGVSVVQIFKWKDIPDIKKEELTKKILDMKEQPTVFLGPLIINIDKK